MTPTARDVSQLPANESPQSRPAKRQKIQIACDVCKSRKSKCDGARPVCGPCARRRGGRDARSCIYRPEKHGDTLLQQLTPPTSTSPGFASAPSSHALATEGLSSGPSPARHNYSGGNNTTRKEHSVHSQSSRADVNDTVHDYARAPSDGSASDRDVDAMGCVDSWALRSGLLGTSSGASLTRQIRKAVDGIDTPDAGARGSRSANVTTKLLKLRRKRDTEKDSSEVQLVLPQRKTADHLFEVYWAYSDVIFPWLDEAEIRRQYESLWTPTDAVEVDEKVLYCTLNFVFAIAAKLDPLSRPEARVKVANTYYERARDLLSFNLLDVSHFEILQALLLAAQYLQSTNMPRQCFQVIGLAVWVAQDLGLHLPETTNLLKDPHEQELARRIWHGCIITDKIAAMTFGRPARIPQAVAEKAAYPRSGGLPAESSSSTAHSMGQPAKLDFFIAFCSLHHILGDVLEAFYNVEDDVGHSSTDGKTNILATKTLEQLFEIDRNLSNWHESLPNQLRAPSSYVDNTKTKHITRQANTLHARYHYLRLLLYRPFLTRAQQLSQAIAADPSSLESRTASGVITECQTRCVQAAQNIIYLIDNNLPIESQNAQCYVLPSPWFVVSYIFTSSLVLLAAQMGSQFSGIVPAISLQSTLDRAYQILQHYDAYTKSASRCNSILRSIHQKINSKRPADSVATTQNSFDSLKTSNNIEGSNMNTISVETEPDFSNLDLSSEDFSWLETKLFDWDDGAFSMTSLNPTLTENWQY